MMPAALLTRLVRWRQFSRQSARPFATPRTATIQRNSALVRPLLDGTDHGFYRGQQVASVPGSPLHFGGLP
jgi:hypothetical protein